MENDIPPEMDFVLELEIILREGIKVSQSSFKVSSDGDNKSCELCVSNGDKEIWISSADVQDYED